MDVRHRHTTRTPAPARRRSPRLNNPVLIAICLVVAALTQAGHTVPQALAAGSRQPAPIQRPGAARSAWDRPVLVDPTTIVISAANHNLVLDQTKDYILRLTPGVDSLPVGLTVWGGHNVVLNGGHLNITGHSGAMQLKNQAGTIWIHDLHISGGPGLMEGIDLQEPMPGATVVLRDILMGEVHGSYASNHADLIQTWAGPSRLLIDGFTGRTGYQGFFLLPNQWHAGPSPKIFDLRNVEIDDSRGGYALWVSDQHGPFPVHVQNVTVRANPARTWRGWWLWGFRGQDSNAPGRGTWAAVTAGVPRGGSYVHATPWGAGGVDESASPAALPRETR